MDVALFIFLAVVVFSVDATPLMDLEVVDTVSHAMASMGVKMVYSHLRVDRL